MFLFSASLTVLATNKLEILWTISSLESNTRSVDLTEKVEFKAWILSSCIEQNPNIEKNSRQITILDKKVLDIIIFQAKSNYPNLVWEKQQKQQERVSKPGHDSVQVFVKSTSTYSMFIIFYDKCRAPRAMRWLELGDIWMLSVFHGDILKMILVYVVIRMLGKS